MLTEHENELDDMLLTEENIMMEEDEADNNPQSFDQDEECKNETDFEF